MLIAFDLSGVFFNDGLTEAVRTISRTFNVEEEAVRFVLNGTFSTAYRTGTIASDEFWPAAGRYLYVDNHAALKKIFFDSYRPHQPTVALIKEIRASGLKTGYISNSPEDRARYLEQKYRFSELFDHGIFSFEAKARKPDVKIFEAFIRKSNLNANEIVYIDDKEENITPARTCGMTTLLFLTTELLREDLERMGLIT
ncbi:MAG: HAD-IA family hydrolase [Nanoarchaeota archaeon]